MRIIAGQYRHRSQQSRPGLDLHPTSDRLRETLFEVLAAVGSLSNSVWADLYAGTGAVGIEALSRGARRVYFVKDVNMTPEAIVKTALSE
jgi:16S rRNA (guanine966-N2)-methyltransferase